MKKKFIVVGIGGLVTGTALKMSTAYMSIAKNKMALLQLSNNNSDYMMYKLFAENSKSINIAILLIGGLITFTIIKNMKDKKESK